MAEQTGFEPYLAENPEEQSSHDEADIAVGLYGTCMFCSLCVIHLIFFCLSGPIAQFLEHQGPFV